MSSVTGDSAGVIETTAGRRVIFASSLGTVFEWYDFYLYATLAPFFAALFFPPGNATAALLASFVTYAAGFLVRPFGALVFGRIGDLVGRKYTFLITIVDALGIRAFLFTLRLERCATRADLKTLLPDYARSLMKKLPTPDAGVLIERTGELLEIA